MKNSFHQTKPILVLAFILSTFFVNAHPRLEITLDDTPCFETINTFENMSVSNTFNGNFYSANFIIDGVEYWITYDSNTGEVNSNYDDVFSGNLDENNDLFITIEVDCDEPDNDDVQDNPNDDNDNGDNNGNNGNNGNQGNGNGNGNNGHGNNEDGVDVSNPGQGSGGPNSEDDQSGSFDDENNGNGGNDDDNDAGDDDNDADDDDNDADDDDNDADDDDDNDADDDDGNDADDDDGNDADDDDGNDADDDDNDADDDDNDADDDDNDADDDDNDADDDDDNDADDDDGNDADDDDNDADVDVITNDNTPCDDPEVTLGTVSTWSTFNGTTYSFDFMVDGESYTGTYEPNNGTVNSNYPDISGEFTSNSVYVIISISNNCGSYVDTLYIHQGNQQGGSLAPPTVEEEITDFSNLSTTEVIYLNVNGEADETMLFKLLDTNGSTKVVQQLMVGQNAVSISAIPKGIYIYQLSKNSQVYKTGKIYVK